VAKKAIPPTRSNYLRTERSLEHTRRGYELLERKRQILVMELMSHAEAARVAQQQVQEALQLAFEALRQAALASGSERLVRESSGIGGAHRLSVRTRSVMGVKVPQISFECDQRVLPFGLIAGASGADEVRRRFRAALEPIVRLAEVENAVLRLAREVRRTQRRVHALENTFIPDYEDTLKFIGETLEERDREDLVIMKKVKQMRQARGGTAPAHHAREGRHG